MDGVRLVGEKEAESASRGERVHGLLDGDASRRHTAAILMQRPRRMSVLDAWPGTLVAIGVASRVLALRSTR